MPIRSPSKYLSLKYLVSLSESDFCNRDKGIDYESSEVLALIYKKQNKTSEVFEKKLLRASDEQIIELLLKSAKKPCTLCRQILPFSEFHADKSKKTFGLRSHCRECRKIPF